ncbi:Disease resistance protein family [Quillaja saponaria]|uniref:Disease resistance protein family n=1 Tax=Quillaja saponaria TaxID=32244 RepID=A0AAD7PD23_QUISA|nr:Disease resistance protein family [Quillaja saponaria]
MMLEGMENLNSIWPQQLSSDSFSKLHYMIIDGCNKLVTVLPFHMLGKFQNLELTVGNCGSVEYIFDLQTDESKYKHGVIGKKKKHIPRVVDARIQFIDLEKLPKLKHIWSKDPQGIFSFKNVQTVSVCECKTLKSVFPASVATSLAQPRNDILAFKYPQLTNLYLDSLPELKSSYPGKHTLQTTKMLTSFGVLSCDKLEAFPAETTSQDPRQPISNKQPILSSVKEVIPYLEELILSGEDANLILHGKYPMDTFRNLTELWVHDMGNSGDEFPYWSLHRIPYLKTLTLQLSPFKGVFPNGSLPALETQIGTDVQLTKLQLLALSELEFICKEGFQLDPVLQMLEYLEIEGCSSLKNLVPFSASFSHLTFLQVENCSRLEYLVAFSTAKSLIQLTRMIISNRQMIEEIISKVSKEADERDQNQEIVFSQLKTLELLDLPILGSFCSSDLVFKFPSLENLIVSQCPKMKIFSKGVITAPKLWKLLVEKKETEEEGESFWAGDLNTTIENLFTNKVAEIAQVAKLVCESEQLNLVSHPELKELWHGDTPLPDKCFSNLKTLVVDKGELVPNSIAIPSNLLSFLNNLEELKVQNCKSVEVIFDVKGLEVTDEGTISFGLKKLILDQLPNLKHVWNKDPQGILSFQSFQKVIVSKCKSLKCLFPSSVAKCLMKLGKIDIRDCGLEEIVEKDEDENEEATKKFVFHRLITLRLWNLQKLKNFYPGRHTLDWWMLKDLDIYDCNGFEMLTSEFQSYRETHPLGQLDIPIYPQPLSFVLKVFPNLEKLSFVRCYFKEILSFEISHDVAHRILARLKELPVLECSGLENLVPSSISFSNLTNLKVHNCHGLENLFTYSIGKSLVQLKVMNISDGRKMEEIVSAEGDDHQSEYKIVFRNLNSLKLVRLPGLASFFTGPSSLRFPSLELVTVTECPQLKRFCEGIISAPKLKEIQVADTTVKKYIKEKFVQDMDPQYSEEEENNNEENEVGNVKGVPGKYLGWSILW